MPKPNKSLLDRTFKYIPAAETDLRKTFARVRREQRKQAEAVEADAKEAAAKVAPLRKPAP